MALYSLVFVCFTVGGLGNGNEFIRADTNLDGKVGISDAIALLSDLFGYGDISEIQDRVGAPCNDALDANDDGKVTLTDPIYILNYLYMGGTPPPAPFPEKGLDETFDQLGC